MERTAQTLQLTDFEKDIINGLTDFPKHLSSKYLYDDMGDALFQEIMHMPTYYLTRTEYAILQAHRKEIAALFDSSGPFDLVELGAGDGKKTKVLLRELSQRQCNFTYIPIDISGNALQQLTASVRNEMPEVAIDGFQGTYFNALQELGERHRKRKVILFLGSNIGNLPHGRAITFLKGLRQLMQPNDMLFIGFDQKKNPQVILDAYNDQEGITAAFNKNILRRINKEAGGNFDLDQFMHWEVYDPEQGAAKSYLVSKVAQTVHLKKLEMEIPFKAWETIYTEVSQKYDDEMVDWLVKEGGLKIHSTYQNAHNTFKSYVLTK